MIFERVRPAAVLLCLVLLASACGGGDDLDAADVIADVTEEAEVVADETDEPLEEDDEVIEAEGEISDEEVAQIFASTLAAGDRETAFSYAQDPALEFFDPWSPNPDASFQGMDGDSFTLALGPGFFVTCTIVDGFVDSCEELPHGEEEEEFVEEEGEPTEFDLPEHGGEEEGGDDLTGQYDYVEYLFPEPGGESIVREEGVVRGEPQDLYVVDVQVCCAGETLNVFVESLETNASFFIYGPDGTELASDTMDATIFLDQVGEYSVEVGTQRGNATYTLYVNVSVNAD